jgi:hypothetical protein
VKVHRAEKRERAASKALDADLYPDLKLDPDRMMPEQTVIVWDLETVPDLAAAARMLDMGLANEAEVRAALGDSFPKHPLHKIVCIGALVASRQQEGWRVDALGAPHIGERSGDMPR